MDHLRCSESLQIVQNNVLEKNIVKDGSTCVIYLFFYEQEPENDPRYCCYLWVARGPLVPENCPETPATLTLYQLVFASKDILPGYGIIYKVVCFLFSYENFILYLCKTKYLILFQSLPNYHH